MRRKQQTPRCCIAAGTDAGGLSLHLLRTYEFILSSSERFMRSLRKFEADP